MDNKIINKLSSDTIVVTGLGMISTIGMDVLTSCASARAGITRESEIPSFSVFDNDSEGIVPLSPLIGHEIIGFSDGFVGLGRLIRLGHAALNNLLDYALISDSKLDKTGFFLSLSGGYFLMMAEENEKKERDEGDDHENESRGESPEMEILKRAYRASLIPKLCKLSQISIRREFQKIFFSDHTGFITALRDAMDILKKGEIDQCIVGGIDSYLEQQTLELLNEFELLKTIENPFGISPGEASAFVLIERFDHALQRNAKIEGILESPSIKYEQMHRFLSEPSIGIALADVISETLDGLADKGKNTGLIIGNLNGDPLKAQEWGNALVRVSAKHRIGDQEQWYPAVSFGETGAATGAIGLCMAIRAFVRNYAKTNNILMWSINDDGYKGAIYIRNFYA